MTQLTIRTEALLADRVRSAAAASGKSMNEFVVMVLDAATNPALAGSKALEIRERLASAGLLATGIPRQGARPSAEVVGAASKRVAVGSSLSDLVSEAR